MTDTIYTPEQIQQILFPVFFAVSGEKGDSVWLLCQGNCGNEK